MAIALIVAAILAAILALALHLASGPLAETEPLLVDESRKLRGRPDYLLRHKKGVIPVELKPLRTSKSLYESDRLQIATYLMLVRTAPYGIVRYKETTFRVYLTKELEARVLAVADHIRTARKASVVHRTHNIPPKCRACAHKAACGEALV